MTETRRRAEELTTRVHAGQVRKGSNEPYINHPRAVADLVEIFGGTEDEVVAALLHDVLEDSDGHVDRALLEREFGEAVAAIVVDCTDTRPGRKPGEPKEPWLDRKRRSLRKLHGMCEASVMVKAADLLHNVSSCVGDYRERGDELWRIFLSPSGLSLEDRRDRVMSYWLAVFAALDALDHSRPWPLVNALRLALVEFESMVYGNADHAVGRLCAACSNPIAALAWEAPMERTDSLHSHFHDELYLLRCRSCGDEHFEIEAEHARYDTGDDDIWFNRLLLTEEEAERLRRERGWAGLELLFACPEERMVLSRVNDHCGWSPGCSLPRVPAPEMTALLAANGESLKKEERDA